MLYWVTQRRPLNPRSGFPGVNGSEQRIIGLDESQDAIGLGVFTDKTTFYKNILWPQNSVTTSRVGKASIVFGSPPPTSTSLVQVLPDGPNPEPDAVVSNKLPPPCNRLCAQ